MEVTEENGWLVITDNNEHLLRDFTVFYTITNENV